MNRYEVQHVHGTALIVDWRTPRVIATASDYDYAQEIVDAMNFAPVRAQMADALLSALKHADGYDVDGVVRRISDTATLCNWNKVLMRIRLAMKSEEDAP